MSQTPNALSLRDRVAVVTGAGRGIGAATSQMLARAGAHVALLDRDAAGVTRTAEAIGLAGGEALPFTNDITDSFAVERTLDRVMEEWGRLDVLVNNAGELREAPLDDLTDDDLEESLDINLRGTLVVTRAAVPLMMARGSGRVLSAASMSTRIGAVGLTAYAASKAAVVGMTRTWARELGPRGITANAVAPGLIDSETTRAVPAGELEATLSRLPARRLGQPDEVAAVYLFLASDLASFINGAVVGVDGGLLLV
ncbi:MAG: SDR family oxidoreductase [Acidobacteria bacterium]|jgi:3-oxoacyl-[acyl-carrier protein] reductase|nr:SDR family oxidoreductase [Acidobacteriota bacterium]